jgi:PAS domain S-box-containing protein
VRHQGKTNVQSMAETCKMACEATDKSLMKEGGLLRAAIDSVPDHIYVKDIESRFVLANTALARHMGVGRPEELLGKTDFDFYPQELATRFFADEQRVVQSGQPRINQAEVGMDRAGHKMWFLGTKVPLRDSSGKIIAIVGSSRDITEQKRAEEALRDSEALYESLVEGLPLNVFRKDSEGRFTFGNRLFCETLGSSLDEIIGKTDFDFFPKELAEKYRKDDRRVVETGKVFEDIEEHRKPDGERIHVQVLKTPVYNFKGITVGMQGIFWDVTEEKRAEEALLQERYLLHSLMDNIPDSIYFKDTGSRFTRINQAQAQRFNLSDPSQAVGKTDFDFFTEEHARAAFEDEQEVMRSGQPLVGKEEKETWPDGRTTWVSTTKMPLRDAEGKIIGTFGVSRDVTDRKRAEEVLRESEEAERGFAKRLATLQEVTNELSQLPSFDDLCRRAVELGRGRLGFDRMSVWLGTDDPGVLRGTFGVDEEGRLRDERGYRMSPPMGSAVRRISAGEMFCVYEADAPLCNERGDVIGRGPRDIAALWDGKEVIGCICTDNLLSRQPITKHQRELLVLYASSLGHLCTRKRAEAALADERNLLRTLIDNVPDCHIFVKDARARFVTTNAAHLRTLGADSLDQVVGKTDFAFFPRELAEPYYADEQKVISSGEPVVDREEPVADQAGGTKWFLTTKVPLRDSSGEVVGLVGMSRDISEHKRADEELKRTAEELKRSNAELEEFAYVASHDLQEPLRMVASYTQLLAKRYKGKFDSDADDFIEYVVGGATRMRRLINDLLMYSRVGTRGRPFEPTDCEAVFKRVSTNLQITILEGNAMVTRDRLPIVMADQTQLEQLFQNLISNAIKFHGEDQPRVHVSAEEKHGEWLFSVQDNGIGIAPEFAERIFVIFQRLHTNSEYAGTGIGLAVCKKIVQRHGGRIWVESEPGKGSTFYFTIPSIGDQ